MKPVSSRRRFLRALWQTGFIVPGIVIAACRGNTDAPPAVTSCDDLSGLSEEDRKLRETFGYVEESQVTDNQCSNCNLWLPNKEDPSCGKCLLFKGPVYAKGHCTSWAPQQSSS